MTECEKLADEIIDDLADKLWDIVNKVLKEKTILTKDDDSIRLQCAILDEVCIDCEEDCPCAGWKK